MMVKLILDVHHTKLGRQVVISMQVHPVHARYAKRAAALMMLLSWIEGVGECQLQPWKIEPGEPFWVM